MLTQTLKTLFERDLNKLRTEIESYKNETNLWIIDKAIANSAGNLCLHLSALAGVPKKKHAVVGVFLHQRH